MDADDRRSRRLVLLRLRLGEGEAGLALVAVMARGLQPGELLLVGSPTMPNLAELASRLEPPGMELMTVSFAPDDHEILVWRPPPGAPSDPGGPVAGELTLDVRDLPPLLALVSSLAAAARLGPGEALTQIGSRPPLLLVDVLAGRAVVAPLTGTADRVVSRFVRCGARGSVTGDAVPPPAAGATLAGDDLEAAANSRS
jgi:hypothetical protein